jgi:NADPH:quinone reductase-like Zn-dependent oxidoreductase
MKAVRFDKYGGIDVLKVEDVPVPEPGEGEAQVKVKAASINPGEVKIREGMSMPFGQQPSPRARAPTSPGS